MGNGESSSKVGLGLAIGGVVVIALGVVLWLALKKDTSASEGTTEQPQGSAVVVRTPGTPTVGPAAPGEHPTLPQAAPGENPKDYVVGDIRVRDHRAGDHKPLDIPPNPHPMEGPIIPSALTHEISQKLRAHVMTCTASLPKDARGEKPRVEGQILITIKDHKVTITKSTMQLRDVTGESVEPTKQCIEQKALGIENSAPEQSDIENYSINVTYAIP